MTGAQTAAAARARNTSYAETYRCPGGALCLDFCNSGEGAKNSGGSEWIASYADLIDWLEGAKGISARQAAQLRNAGAASPRAAARVWQRALLLRETLFRVFNATAAGDAVPAADLASIQTEYARALSFARLARTQTGYAWSLEPSPTAPEAALQPIIESALRLLMSDALAQLRRCGNSTCYWLFIDETRNRSRRWCEMASCGNLVKVRRHRKKVRSAVSRHKPLRAA